MSLPVEKQWELSKTPISVPIQNTALPILSQVKEERLELAADASRFAGVDA